MTDREIIVPQGMQRIVERADQVGRTADSPESLIR